MCWCGAGDCARQQKRWSDSWCLGCYCRATLVLRQSGFRRISARSGMPLFLVYPPLPIVAIRGAIQPVCFNVPTASLIRLWSCRVLAYHTESCVSCDQTHSLTTSISKNASVGFELVWFVLQTMSQRAKKYIHLPKNKYINKRARKRLIDRLMPVSYVVNRTRWPEEVHRVGIGSSLVELCPSFTSGPQRKCGRRLRTRWRLV